MRIRNSALFAAKATVGMLLLALIVWRLDPERLVAELVEPVWPYLLLAVLSQLLAKLVWALRWQVLLSACDIHRKFWELVGLVHIGLFFNNFLPSSVGGDAVRGYYASNSRGDLATSFGALLVERIIGLIVLAALCTAASLHALAFEQTMPPAMLVAAATASVVILTLGSAVFFTPLVKSLPARLTGKLSQAGTLIDGLSKGWAILRSSRSRQYAVVLTTVVLQLLAILFYYFCARSMNIPISLASYFVVVPIAVVASMLPISLNGLGLREGVFVTLLYQQGVPIETAGAFSLLALAIATSFSVGGGILYAVWKPVRLQASTPVGNSFELRTAPADGERK